MENTYIVMVFQKTEIPSNITDIYENSRYEVYDGGLVELTDPFLRAMEQQILLDKFEKMGMLCTDPNTDGFYEMPGFSCMGYLPMGEGKEGEDAAHDLTSFCQSIWDSNADVIDGTPDFFEYHMTVELITKHINFKNWPVK